MNNLPDQQPPSEPNVLIEKQNFFQTTKGKIATIAGLIFILILIIPVVLNYFNIPPLSQKLPNTTLSSSEEQHLNRTAQSLIDSIVQPQYRTKIILKELRFSPGYLTSWEVASVSAKLSVRFDFEKRKMLDIDLSIGIPYTSNFVSSDSISKILSAYLILPSQAKLTCEKPNNAGITQCHSMVLREDQSKLGVSFRTSTIKSDPSDIINICQIFSGSNLYKWGTCLHE